MASEGNGEYVFVESRMLTSGGEPIPGVVIESRDVGRMTRVSNIRFFPFLLC